MKLMTRKNHFFYEFIRKIDFIIAMNNFKLTQILVIGTSLQRTNLSSVSSVYFIWQKVETVEMPASMRQTVTY